MSAGRPGGLSGPLLPPVLRHGGGLSRRGGRKRPIRICPRDAAEAELEAARCCGAVPVFTIEPNYPAALAALEAPPPMLYIKGRVEFLNRPAVAISGCRLVFNRTAVSREDPPEATARGKGGQAFHFFGEPCVWESTQAARVALSPGDNLAFGCMKV